MQHFSSMNLLALNQLIVLTLSGLKNMLKNCPLHSLFAGKGKWVSVGSNPTIIKPIKREERVQACWRLYRKS